MSFVVFLVEIFAVEFDAVLLLSAVANVTHTANVAIICKKQRKKMS